MSDFISDYVGSNAFLGFVIEECHHKLLFVSLPLTFSVSNIINDYVFNPAFPGKVHLCIFKYPHMYFHRYNVLQDYQIF